MWPYSLVVHSLLEQGTPSLAQVDMEDMAGAAPKASRGGAKRAAAEDGAPTSSSAFAGPPEMLTPLVRSSLTKQVGILSCIDLHMSGCCVMMWSFGRKILYRVLCCWLKRERGGCLMCSPFP